MKLIDKYISKSENDKNPDVKKVIVSDEMYGLFEFIEVLTQKIQDLRFRNG